MKKMLLAVGMLAAVGCGMEERKLKDERMCGDFTEHGTYQGCWVCKEGNREWEFVLKRNTWGMMVDPPLVQVEEIYKRNGTLTDIQGNDVSWSFEKTQAKFYYISDSQSLVKMKGNIDINLKCDRKI